MLYNNKRGSCFRNLPIGIELNRRITDKDVESVKQATTQMIIELNSGAVTFDDQDEGAAGMSFHALKLIAIARMVLDDLDSGRVHATYTFFCPKCDEHDGGEG